MNAGTLVITNAASTQIKTKTVSGVVRNNVVHQFNGGAHPDSMDFVFDWIAPSTNIGDVTFSAAGIAADNSGDEFGDYVYNETKVVSAGSALAVSEINDNGALSVNTFPTQHLLTVDYKIEKSEEIVILIHDVNGHQISKTVFGIVTGGLHHEEITLPYSMSSGIYLVTLQSRSKKVTKKISVIF
ncbi:hypothetical protein BH11BAC2_BH11BAC2_22330 [soil metagenome]